MHDYGKTSTLYAGSNIGFIDFNGIKFYMGSVMCILYNSPYFS